MDLKLAVNGELKQDSNTSYMMYSILEQLSVISHFITLEPGDVVFTGSPSGSGASTGQFLLPGDTIEAEIQGLDSLYMEIMPDDQKLPG